ncbi:aminoglycoside phosphotransferase (APT) family kinase protein [Geomicrobium halophilum]|uniref:Aminoglycoside phosphotransferase (APT) family kinase protein n=1 Tax=Geomicrobium halophilum TaxID=549000 RepID=A0A841PZK2_9BACL|nr:phosphotransferase family protein [Geomicrobium halophilum]MBB6450152.1 aminoglycoside phosphotransferase (APT) family kinase protein [Geomicrobium halophilum]
MEVIPVRKGEELDKQRLHDFLKQNLSDLPEGELELHQFSSGHSNLTYQLNIDSWEVVLRRPPLGPVAPKAHDMGREYRFLKEIHPFFNVAPKPLLFSEDKTIVGAPFWVMERKRGQVIDTEYPEGIQVTEELNRGISETMVDHLVDLHAIDYTKTGLTEMTKPEGFMERQVNGWISRYQRAKTDDFKEAELLMNWLSEHLPPQRYTSVIHYDYKLNNAMFNHNLSKMTGLFDWEMATVGDPLADLGAAMSYWLEADDPEELKRGLGREPVTIRPGFFTRDEFIERYSQKSGRDVTHIHYYLTFAYFKLAVILQQIYYRYKKGQTEDERFARFGQSVQALLQTGWDTALKR